VGDTEALRGVTKFSIGLLCAAALLAILLILSGSEIDETSAKAIGTAAALAFLSLTGVAGSNLAARRPQLALFGQATALISALTFVIIAIAIWTEPGDAEWIFCVAIVAFACGHSSILLASGGDRDSDGVRLVCYGTLASLWLVVAMAITEISENGHQVSVRAMGVAAVVYALGTFVLPLLRRMESSRPPRREEEELHTDHVCFVWPGNVESAVVHLTNRGLQVVEGPVPRRGTQGPGTSVYYRDPDGSLVELISYS
jgi:catechol 2,3-dioxygenase-like lactoylglutathione lyase family enzyme